MHLRRLTTAALGFLLMATHVSFAAPKSSEPKSQQYYGRVTSVEPTSVTVHNKKKNQDATFQITGETRVTKNKTSVSPSELKVGQSLAVYYISENDVLRARRISVRPTKEKVE